MTPRTAPPRTALVTGSAQGIGRAIADALIESGHQVDRRRRPIEHDLGPRTPTLVADLADPDGIAGLIDAAGDVDILVNNAAILVERPIEDISIAEFDRRSPSTCGRRSSCRARSAAGMRGARLGPDRQHLEHRRPGRVPSRRWRSMRRRRPG